MPRLNKTVYTKRQTNLSWAICSTLMCICFPIGLVAILVALKSKRAWTDDRPETAGDMADMAKTIALIAILCSIIIICIFAALLASGYFYQVLGYYNIISNSTMNELVVSQGEPPVSDSFKMNKKSGKNKEEEYEYYYYYDNVPVTAAKVEEAKEVKQE